jgi:hypothetical protein
MKKYISLIVLILIGVTSCEEDLVVFDVENGQTLAQFSQASAVVPTPAEGASVSVDVTVTTKSDSDRTISVAVDPSSTATSDQYAISGGLTIPAGTFVGTLLITSNFEALPDEGSVNLVLNLTDVSGSNDIKLANSTLNVELFRECPSAPTAGVWTVNMEDSYGDGWQTTTANGGPGITCTLSTGEVFEVGLCTPYESSPFNCTPEFSSGSATITIPDGVESAEWFFPGDFWGEISFTIVAPSGNVVASGGGTGPEIITIDVCKQ